MKIRELIKNLNEVNIDKETENLRKIEKIGQIDSSMFDTYSFAIWNPSNVKDTDYIIDNIDQANFGVIVVGMNQSQKVSPFGIFHEEKSANNLKKAFENGVLNKYYGAIVTDLLNIMDGDNIVYEPKSNILKNYLKTKKGRMNLKNALSRFKKIYNTLTKINGKPPKIIALGDIVQDNLYYPGIINIQHPAYPTSQENYELKNRIATGVATPEDYRQEQLLAYKRKKLHLTAKNYDNKIQEIQKNIIKYKNKKQTEKVISILNKLKKQQGVIAKMQQKIIDDGMKNGIYSNYKIDKKHAKNLFSDEEIEAFYESKNIFAKILNELRKI